MFCCVGHQLNKAKNQFGSCVGTGRLLVGVVVVAMAAAAFTELVARQPPEVSPPEGWKARCRSRRWHKAPGNCLGSLWAMKAKAVKR